MPAQINILDEIIVDNFTGGGGASTGIELAGELRTSPYPLNERRTNDSY